mgnify:CR=1 FL=1
MKLIVLFTMFLFAATYSSSAQEMPLETQPTIWLRADMVGSNPNQWQNQADSMHHAYRLGQLGLPDTTVLNFQKAFDINSGSNPFVISDFYPSSSDKYTLFTVYQSTDTISEYGLWSMQLDSNTNIKLSTTKIKNTKKYNRYSTMGSMIPIINYSTQSWRRINIDSNMCSFKIAGTDSFELEGKFAEFIAFNDKIKRIDNEKVHTYLSLKYGIGFYFLNYVNSQDTIIWDYKKNLDYQYDVVGLGRDDSLGIYQKQTAAEGGQSDLLMYMGNIVDMNNNNVSTLDNFNFVLYGHNGDSLNQFDLDTNNIQGFPYLMSRKWKIRTTGNTIQNKKCNVQYHYQDMDTAHTLILVINKLGNEVFDPNECEIIYPNNIDSINKTYTYKNIKWDKDNSGSDVFTFMRTSSSSQNQRLTQGSNINDEEIDNESEQQYFDYSLAPNPSEGRFRLTISSNTKQSIRMIIYDINGKEMLREQYSGSNEYFIEKTISVSGTYLISLQGENETKSVKLIIN